LNSIDWEEVIIVSENDQIIVKSVGEYIDHKIKLGKNVKRLDDNKENEMGNIYYVDTNEENISAISVDKTGKLSWNKVSALTKHLPINKDGSNDLVKITTKLGKTVTATKAKSFLTRINNEIVPIRGDEIKVGMKVPIIKRNQELRNIREKEILDDIINSGVCYDDIITIEIVKPTHEYVYDLTVENDKTFALYNGIMMEDTFHHAGIQSSVSLGVPRIKELLSLSRNLKTPVMTIYLDKEHMTDKETANKIGSYLKHTTIKDIRKMVAIYYDPDPMRKGGFMEKDHVYNPFYSYKATKTSCQSDFGTLPLLIRLELDREKMMEKDITLLDIKSKFCHNWERRYNDIKGMKKEERVLLERIIQLSVLSNSENSKNPIIHIRFNMTAFEYSTMVSFIDTFVDNFKLKGIDGIDKIENVVDEGLVIFDDETGELKKIKQWVLYILGINLTQLRYINGIDLNRTICNDMMLIYDTYGIDALRMALIKEFNNVYITAGSTINFAHIELLCDVMTNTGIPTSIDRHGMNKSEIDPLARASFEKTVEQFINAAIFAEVDHMVNVSSRIMAGLVIKGGTGICNLILDTKLLEKSEYIEETGQKYEKVNEMSTSSVITDVIKKEITGIFIPE